MSRFKNGEIPRDLLVELAPYHWMPAATADRWKRLVDDVRENEGVTLYITPGKNAYRDYEGQVFARNNACAEGNCNDAAVPGTSSHGGEYQGRDSQAIDVANWAELGQSKWYDYCRKHGFEPGFFDWEPWHIIDWSPWTGSGGGKSPSTTEEDDMPIMVKANTNIYVLSPGQIKLCDTTQSVADAKAVGVVQKDLTGTVAEINRKFANLLDIFGVPRQVLNGNGWVLNPENGSFEKNGLWSWERANKAILATKK